MGYEDEHPIFSKADTAANEVVLSFIKMPAAYKEVFGREICRKIGLCGSYLDTARYKGNKQEKLRCLNTADGYLSEVKYWVNRSTNLFYYTKTGAKRFSIPPKRAAACYSALAELGCLIGGWKGSL